MPNFTNFPAPNLPLTGAESLMIAQAQNGQLVTCTATVAEIGTGAIGGALSSPPPIGNVTPNTGAFTTLDAQAMSVSGNETIAGTLNVVGNTTVNNLTVEGIFSGPVPTLPAQAANTFFSGPASDGAQPPAFRDIVSADINSALTTPGPIGSGSPNVGDFTTISASSEITANGAGTGLDVVNNAVVGGTLSVTGNSALSTVTASGEITANGAGTGLDVVNNASVGGALTVSGELEANGAGVGIAVANNATVGGTLSVTGASTLGAVTASGEVIAGGAGTGLSVTNNALIGGTLGVSGTSVLAGEVLATASGTGLSVANNATVGGTLGVGGEVTVTASGTGLAITNNATIGGTLAVTGVATVGAGNAEGDASQIGQVQNNAFNFSSNTTNVGNAYTASYTPAITAYTEGMILSFLIPESNTGPSSFNAGPGALNILGGAGVSLQGVELGAGRTAEVQFSQVNNAWFLIGGQSTTQVLTAGFSLQAPQWGQVFAGNNAVYNNVTTSRSLGTTFTNSTGKPILVIATVGFTVAGSTVSAVVNGILVSQYEMGVNFEVAMTFVVPPGETYAVEVTSSGILALWFELF
jgi:hypothetical protein